MSDQGQYIDFRYHRDFSRAEEYSCIEPMLIRSGCGTTRGPLVADWLLA